MFNKLSAGRDVCLAFVNTIFRVNTLKGVEMNAGAGTAGYVCIIANF